MARKPATPKEPVETTTGSSPFEALDASLAKNKFDELLSIVRSDVDEQRVIATGCRLIDWATGRDGFPVGRVVELYGPESAGKTTLVYLLAAAVLAQSQRVLYIDMEHAFDVAYLRSVLARFGAAGDLFRVVQPVNAEAALGSVVCAVESKIELVVLDSVASLLPSVEADSGEVGRGAVGLQAGLLSAHLRKVVGAAARSGSIVVYTNQIREKVGVTFGNPETTPGGRALRHYASLRLDVRRIGEVKVDGAVCGQRSRLRVTKNKVGPPRRSVEFDILFDRGVDVVASNFDLLVQLKVIEKSGSWFSLKGARLGLGRAAALSKVRHGEALHESFVEAVRAVQPHDIPLSLET